MELTNIKISVVQMKPSDIKKYTKLLKRKQNFETLDVQPVENMLYDPLLFCRATFTFKEQLIFDEIVKLDNKYRQIYCTQTTIAKAAGSTRPNVVNIIKKFELAGFLVTNYRHKLSCEYKLSSYFHKPENRALLAPIFPALGQPRNFEGS